MKIIQTNSFFDLIQVGSCSYAAISHNPMTMANAGFVDLGNILVVIDTFLSIDAALELKKIIKEFPYEKLMVVNTHPHFDHYMGNVVFKDEAIFISSKETSDEIKQFGQRIPKGYQFESELKSLEERFNKAQTDEEKVDINNSKILYSNLKHPDLEFIDTNLIILDELTITGTKGELILKLTHQNHSPSDIYGIVKQDQVIYTGDLLFVGEHPYIGAGNPYQFIKELVQLTKIDTTYFIPGHGPVSGKEAIDWEIEYIQSLIKLVKENIDHPELISVNDLDEKFQNMVYTPFRWNIDALVKLLKG